MKNQFVNAVIALSLALSCFAAEAEVLATCGASKGHAFYLPGSIVPADKAGWREDAITGGAFQLIRSGNDYDIIFTDASGGTLSAKGDGGKVLALENAKGDLIVTVIYARVIETYAFWFSSRPLLTTYSQVKHDTPIAKHSIFKADCKALATE